MRNFERYAERIISGLAAPDAVDSEQLNSPLEGVFYDVKGTLIEVISFSQVQEDQKKLTPKEMADIENGVLVSGMESLAFYKSIHYINRSPFKGKWGVFVFDYALSYLSHEISDFYHGSFSGQQCLEYALKLLYFHERFHFRFDCWAISHESTTRKPLYENYINNIYRAFHPGEFVYEESLANLHSLSSIARFGLHDFAKEFMLSQPGAYSRIVGVDRRELRSKLAAQFFYGRGQIVGEPFFMLPEHCQYLAAPDTYGRTDDECPLFIVKDVSASQFVLSNISLPEVREIEKKYLSKYLKGQEKRTDHKYFIIDNGEKIKCPNPHNKIVKLREFINIVKKSGLNKDEYFLERDKTGGWKKYVPRERSKPSLLSPSH